MKIIRDAFDKTMKDPAFLEEARKLFIEVNPVNGADAAALSRSALAHNLVLAPGNVFSANQSAPDFMRFNVAQSQDERLFAFLRQALGVRGARGTRTMP